MSPPRLDHDILTRRLRLLDETLTQLREVRDVDAARLEREPLTRAAVERLIQVAVDLAIDINAHVAVGLGGAAPQTGRESFATAAEVGALDPQLAERLAPAAGLRNVLVHRYIDIDVGLVAEAVCTLLDLAPRYVAEVAQFLRERRS